MRQFILPIVVVLLILMVGSALYLNQFFVTKESTTLTKIEIIDITSKRDSIGNLIIVGEVKNKGKMEARFQQISCRGYDDNGKLVDADTTYTEPNSFSPGEDALFTSYLEELRPIKTFSCKPIFD